MQSRPTFSWKRSFQKILRTTVITCAALFLVLVIAAGVMSNRRSETRWDYENEREAQLSAIIDRLEYTGLDDAAKQAMSDFSAKYNDYSNFIVINSSFRVLYSLNQGFLDDSGNFYAIMSQNNEGWSIAYICDKDGMILSQHHLETRDSYSFQRLSQGFSQEIKTLGPDDELSSLGGAEYSVAYGGYRMIGSNLHITTYDNSNHSMRYAGIPSKNMHLFYIYDGSSARWTPPYSGYDGFARATDIMQILGILSFMAYWLLLPLWIFIDASKRDNHPALWGILALFTNVVGLIVYLVVRPERPACKNCGEGLSSAFVVCPICGTRNKEQCCSCGRVIEQAWLCCPYCGKEIVGTDGGEKLATVE